MFGNLFSIQVIAGIHPLNDLKKKRKRRRKNAVTKNAAAQGDKLLLQRHPAGLASE